MKAILAIILIAFIALLLCGIAFGVIWLAGKSPSDRLGWLISDAYDSIYALRNSVRDEHHEAYIKTHSLFDSIVDNLLDIEKIVQEMPIDAPEDER